MGIAVKFHNVDKDPPCKIVVGNHDIIVDSTVSHDLVHCVLDMAHLKWTHVDQDHVLPSNLARHVGYFKPRMVARRRTVADRLRLSILLGSLLTAWLRPEVYEPAYNELLQDYLWAKKQIGGSCRWLTIRFGLGAMLLVADCWRVLFLGKILEFLWALVPAVVKRLWLG